MTVRTRRASKAVAWGVVLVPVAAIGSVGSSSSAASAPAADTTEPPVVQLLSRGTVAEPFELEAHGIELEAERSMDVATAHLTFAPGATTGWHRHPGPTVVTLISGELTVTDRECEAETFEAGDTFVEAGPPEHLAVNTGDTATETFVTFFVPEGAPALTTPAAAPSCAD